jgi:hypothetical protein
MKCKVQKLNFHFTNRILACQSAQIGKRVVEQHVWLQQFCVQKSLPLKKGGNIVAWGVTHRRQQAGIEAGGKLRHGFNRAFHGGSIGHSVHH